MHIVVINAHVFVPTLFVNEEQAQISRRRGPLGSTDIPSAAESFHVGRDTASEVWVSLGLDCWEAETEMKVITYLIISDMLSTGFARFTLFFPKYAQGSFPFEVRCVLGIDSKRAATGRTSAFPGNHFYCSSSESCCSRVHRLSQNLLFTGCTQDTHKRTCRRIHQSWHMTVACDKYEVT